MPQLPSIHFMREHTGPWVDAIDALGGFIVTLTFKDGHTIDGELLGDGNNGHQIRLHPLDEHGIDTDTEHTFLTGAIASVTVL